MYTQIRHTHTTIAMTTERSRLEWGTSTRWDTHKGERIRTGKVLSKRKQNNVMLLYRVYDGIAVLVESTQHTLAHVPVPHRRY
jgi:hypothetical protein